VEKTVIRTYSAETPLRHPFLIVKEIISGIRDARELAWVLFSRDVRAQYRQTYLGYFWAFIPPLAASLTFIFLQSQGIVSVDSGSVPYPAFAMIGTLLWQVFVESLLSPSQSLLGAKSMLVKINFPRAALFLSGVYLTTFNFLIRLFLLVAVLLYWDIPLSSSVLLFPLTVLALMACGFAFGLMIAPIGALYGDVSRAIPVLAQFGMLLTPVVYPPQTAGIAGYLTSWNPVSPLIVSARECLTGQELTMIQPFMIVFGVSVGIVFLALVLLRVAFPRIIERMGG
jgi:homopolymeric O-antigen transport system permease protein